MAALPASVRVRVPVPVKCAWRMVGRSAAARVTHCRWFHVNQLFSLLIEDVQRLVAEFGELRAPAGAALDRVVVQDGADDEDFLAVS